MCLYLLKHSLLKLVSLILGSTIEGKSLYIVAVSLMETFVSDPSLFDSTVLKFYLCLYYQTMSVLYSEMFYRFLFYIEYPHNSSDEFNVYF